MLATAIIFLGTGLPAVALGVYLQRQPPKQRKARKKAGARPPRAGSFLLGGALVTLAGLGFLAAHLAG